jgi:hypothetical protein
LAQTDLEKEKSAEAIDPKTGKPVGLAEAEPVPVMPPLNERSLTVDKEFSKLVGMAKIQGPETASAPSSGTGAAPAPKPDMTVGRGEATSPVFFKQPGA